MGGGRGKQKIDGEGVGGESILSVSEIESVLADRKTGEACR